MVDRSATACRADARRLHPINRLHLTNSATEGHTQLGSIRNETRALTKKLGVQSKMRSVAIAIAALSVLALPAAVQAAQADQLFAQGGTSPTVGGNGQSGNPGISPDRPDPTYPGTSTAPMPSHHHYHHYHHHHYYHHHHHMTPGTAPGTTAPGMSSPSSPPPAPAPEPSTNTPTPAPGGAGSGK